MTRQEAEMLVHPHIVMIAQYQSVSHAIARNLLGDDRFERLMADKIRNVGPTTDTVYPWNVVDYIHVPDLNAAKQ